MPSSGGPSYSPWYTKMSVDVFWGRFPYGLYFRLVEEEWRVIACTHLRRHARRWQTRR